MTPHLALWCTSAIAALLFTALAFAVARARTLYRIDVRASAVRGQWITAALLFTKSGRNATLSTLSAMSLAAALLLHTPLTMPLAIVVAQILSQAVAESLKRIINRARPDAWIGRQDTGLSFPSGHATTAVVFYGSWAVVTMLSPLPVAVKLPLAVALVCWSIGIDWSRIALGAHYATDIAGGTLLGITASCTMFALLTA